MTANPKLDLTRHPCFNPGVKGQFGRIHLPVAPNCNIKCNYCNRKYDCVNESRPGVTSTVLSPGQALVYMEKILAREPRLTVMGLAGPGDPFANPVETMETLRLIRQKFPEMLLCLASNGLAIAPYIKELAELAVSHVTITVNAVDPAISRQIYSWVREKNIIYRGLQAAELMLARQLAAIKLLKHYGITVKINTIIVPGINDQHVEEIARTMQGLGVDLHNCMALFPNTDTPFAALPQPDKAMMARLRGQAEKYLPQMRHCTRCRADAVGLLDHDQTEEFRGCLAACATLPLNGKEQERPYVAVATMEGLLINQHLGEAAAFQIWGRQEDTYELIEERPAPPPGDGIRRWLRLAGLLKDCRAVLVSGIGEKPREILKKSGLQAFEMSGFIDAALKTVYEGKKTTQHKGRRAPCAAGGCKGSGGGCL